MPDADEEVEIIDKNPNKEKSRKRPWRLVPGRPEDVSEPIEVDEE